MGLLFCFTGGKGEEKISARLEEDGILINRKLVAKVFIILLKQMGEQNGPGLSLFYLAMIILIC